MGTSINQVLGNQRGFEELQESEVGQKIAQPERFLVEIWLNRANLDAIIPQL
ncbi:hypothetical protein RintRC_0265 [Richelia intracellularis]|nr:hypothetical protein RintRC_0265 [Richelia intracellularis]